MADGSSLKAHGSGLEAIRMPFGEPGADWLLLDTPVHFRHTLYDLTAAAANIGATSYPDARTFADQYVLHPPSAAAMQELFESALGAPGTPRAVSLEP